MILLNVGFDSLAASQKTVTQLLSVLCVLVLPLYFSIHCDRYRKNYTKLFWQTVECSCRDILKVSKQRVDFILLQNLGIKKLLWQWVLHLITRPETCR